MITMLNSVKNRASCTDERYLLIIDFLCKSWQKEPGGWKSKSEVNFDLLLISQLLIDYE